MLRNCLIKMVSIIMLNFLSKNLFRSEISLSVFCVVSIYLGGNKPLSLSKLCKLFIT